MRPPYPRLPSDFGSGETPEPLCGDSNSDPCTAGDALRGAAPGTAPAPHCETSRPSGTTHGEGGHPDTWTQEGRGSSGVRAAATVKSDFTKPADHVLSG